MRHAPPAVRARELRRALACSAALVAAALLCLAVPRASGDLPPATPDTPAPVPARPPGAPEPGLPTSLRRTLLKVEGRPAILTYARGIKDSLDLAAYRDAGFNSVVVDVPWKEKLELAASDSMVRSAHRMGLAVIVQFHAGEPDPALKLRVDAADDGYRKAATEYLREAVYHYRSFLGVDMLMTEDDSEQHVQDDDEGFRSYVSPLYPSLAALNADWGSAFTRPEAVTRDAAVQVSALQYGGLSAPLCWSAGTVSAAYRGLMSLWAEVIHSSDPVRPLLAGRQDTPRATICVPRSYVGTVVSAAPPDRLSVDVARRAGAFTAIVSVPAPSVDNAEVLEPFLRGCLVHGAGGVAFPSWEALATDRALRSEVKAMLRRLQALTADLDAPLATSAIVYEPFAPGVPTGGINAPFGFMPQPADSEPGVLMQVLSRGSIYGFSDVVGVDDLTPAALAHYRVVFLPSLFDAPPAAVAALRSYVSGGGVVVADLGADLFDLHRPEAPWRDDLSELFGITALQPLQYGPIPYEWHERARPPLGSAGWFPLSPRPDLFPGINDTVIRTLALRPVPFSGPRGYARLRAGVDVGRFGLNPPLLHNGADASGVFIRPLGQGLAIFSSFRLWSRWSPADPLFPIFHGGLLARGGGMYLDVGEGDPSDVEITPTAAGDFELMPRVPQDRLVRVHLPGAHLDLRTGCVLQGTPAEPDAVFAYVSLPAQAVAICRAVPVTVEPKLGFVTAVLDAYGPHSIRFKVCGTGSTVRFQDGRVHIVPGQPAEATITVRNGVYPVAAGSRHVAVIEGPGEAPHKVLLVAGPDRTLSFSRRFQAHSVQITPAAD